MKTPKEENPCPECLKPMILGGRVPSHAGGEWLILYCRNCETFDAVEPVALH